MAVKKPRAINRYSPAELTFVENGSSRPWSIVKVSWTLRVPEETEHAINLLSLHFGISKNAVAVHAVHKLWEEVSESIHPEDLVEYERRLKAARIWRIKRDDARARGKREKALKNLERGVKRSRQKSSEQKRLQSEQQKAKTGFERFIDKLHEDDSE